MMRILSLCLFLSFGILWQAQGGALITTQDLDTKNTFFTVSGAESEFSDYRNSLLSFCAYQATQENFISDYEARGWEDEGELNGKFWVKKCETYPKFASNTSHILFHGQETEASDWDYLFNQCRFNHRINQAAFFFELVEYAIAVGTGAGVAIGSAKALDTTSKTAQVIMKGSQVAGKATVFSTVALLTLPLASSTPESLAEPLPIMETEVTEKSFFSDFGGGFPYVNRAILQKTQDLVHKIGYSDEAYLIDETMVRLMMLSISACSKWMDENLMQRESTRCKSMCHGG